MRRGSTARASVRLWEKKSNFTGLQGTGFTEKLADFAEILRKFSGLISEKQPICVGIFWANFARNHSIFH